MKVAPIKRRKDGCRVMQVLFAASGGLLPLPKTHSHIKNDQLLEILGMEATGTASLSQCVLGGPESQDIRVAWRHAGFLGHPEDTPSEAPPTQPIPIYWICAALAGPKSSSQFSLW
jgi:hypothetical protein